MATCFHHTEVETGRQCTRCGRPACHVCLRQASVGAHCFECVKASAPSKREQRIVQRASGRQPRVTATLVLVAANVAVFFGTHELGELGGSSLRFEVTRDYSVWGPGVDVLGEWWRIVTGTFLHADIRHVAMNMIMLFLLGRRLEQVVGVSRFCGIYAVSLLGGSAGALLLSPNSPTVGASGAVYGLMGALFLTEKLSGGDPWNDGIGSLIAINVVISFLIPNISIGGHLGGLVAGVFAGIAVGDQRRRLTRTDHARQWLLLFVIGVIAVGVAFYGASTWSR